ncbi:MAG: ABC transporter ATP-binding protein [Desulfobacterales bacterium]|nr:ABC transporter ATP-binding protein [Desulfobacterales bacterium]
MLQLKGVFSQYEDKVSVLRDITMSFERGKTTCVLGPNGAGKSTLVKTIVHLVKPRAGQIVFSNMRIDQMKTHKIINMGISVVPEARQLFPSLTVNETLRIGGYCENDRKVIDQRMRSTFEIFPILTNRLSQLAGTLSGGEQTILSIARALMADPKMILMDEPSLGLAPMISDRVFRAITDINKREITILLIEQNAVKSMRIASFGYILQKGEIVAYGDTEDLKANDIVRKAYLLG